MVQRKSVKKEARNELSDRVNFAALSRRLSLPMLCWNHAQRSKLVPLQPCRQKCFTDIAVPGEYAASVFRQLERLLRQSQDKFPCPGSRPVIPRAGR